MNGKDTSLLWCPLLPILRRIHLPRRLCVTLQPLGEIMAQQISGKGVGVHCHFSWPKYYGLSFLHLRRPEHDLGCLTGPG